MLEISKSGSVGAPGRKSRGNPAIRNGHCGRRVNPDVPGETPRRLLRSFCAVGTCHREGPALRPKSRKTNQAGGRRTGHRAVSGASESAWPAWTRRSQAALRSPEVMARCEERHEWRGPGQLECNAAESSPSAQLTEQRVATRVRSRGRRCRGVACAAPVSTGDRARAWQ